ncbi:arginine/lysine/ornithine decarboxylase [Anaerotaenia torta]|uniref:aminotransferase class I/II-fold pyridoxal phosphate-dependent enzyme n=1 Tax=Anaerotaenia torta TaxID=433293 RepID=UPI003D208A8D
MGKRGENYLASDGLYDKLIKHSKDGGYPMHMPGHKRNTELCRMDNPYCFDITEIDGFDNLHQPEGILRSLSERISRLYGAEASYPLVNGSTAGILAGISAAVKRGDKVLLGRNCHKAVYHGVILRGLVPVYCHPQKIDGIPSAGGILPEDLEKALITHPDIRLVIITSPTYEGVVSDIGAIAELVHRYGAYLLVDEAHGAHFGFSRGFPESAVRLGADLVIQSLHKTLPAFTQTAVLHSNAAALDSRLRQYLAVYQSSSPSYVLMAGMDQCIRLLEERAEELFEAYERRLLGFYKRMEKLKHLSLLRPDIAGKYGVYGLDPSKITVIAAGTGFQGHELHQLLQKRYHMMLEMEAPDYILAMTSICDTDEGFEGLARALLEIDSDIEKRAAGDCSGCGGQECSGRSHQWMAELQPERGLLPWEAWEKEAVSLDFEESAGRVSAAFLSLFPPGAPVLVPGEIISPRLIDYILEVQEQGITVTGLTGGNGGRIEVVE